MNLPHRVLLEHVAVGNGREYGNNDAGVASRNGDVAACWSDKIVTIFQSWQQLRFNRL